MEKEQLKTFAKELGFAWCGITSAAPLEEYARFAAWLAAGRHADMAYLASEKTTLARSDPRQLVPQAQTVIVCAAMYPTPTVLPEDAGLGGVAAYAVGDDYHEALSDRLWELCRWIEGAAGRAHRHRVYTDSGPVLERELAVRAGLGWIGKNSMAIHPQLGSHFFLAEIITDYRLEPDVPDGADRCGTCQRCVTACPTGCILPDRTVDSNRCLAYLTIEKRGGIPREYREKLGGWVFGCDVCQSVCPWNRPSALLAGAKFSPRRSLPFVNLKTALGYSEQDYAELFQKSALRRARRDGWRRNVIIAAGNSRQPAMLPGLLEAMSDPDPMIRTHAAWAIGRQNTSEAKNALRNFLGSEQDDSVRFELTEALKDHEEKRPPTP
jgi:epoxyqueuosine reductase